MHAGKQMGAILEHLSPDGQFDMYLSCLNTGKNTSHRQARTHPVLNLWGMCSHCSNVFAVPLRTAGLLGCNQGEGHTEKD